MKLWGLITLCLILPLASTPVLGDPTEDQLSPQDAQIFSAVDSLLASNIFDDADIEKATLVKLSPNGDVVFPIDRGGDKNGAGPFERVEFDHAPNPSPIRRGRIWIDVKEGSCLPGSTVVKHYRKKYGFPGFDPPSPHGGLQQQPAISYLVQDKTVRLAFKFESRNDVLCLKAIIIDGSFLNDSAQK